jgi:hypothetical protein
VSQVRIALFKPAPVALADGWMIEFFQTIPFCGKNSPRFHGAAKRNMKDTHRNTLAQ